MRRTARGRADLKVKVLRLQGGRCAYCGDPIAVGDPEDLDKLATWDEVIPRSRGGRRTPGNTVLACLACNARKGSDLWEPLPTIARRRDRARLPYDVDDYP